MGIPNPVYTYTTSQEIAFLRNLAAHGDCAKLEKLRRAYASRSWEGRGMSVDKAQVLAELDAIIAGERAARAVARGTVLASTE